MWQLHSEHMSEHEPEDTRIKKGMAPQEGPGHLSTFPSGGLSLRAPRADSAGAAEPLPIMVRAFRARYPAENAHVLCFTKPDFVPTDFQPFECRIRVSGRREAL